MSAVVSRSSFVPEMTYIEIFLGEIVVDILNSKSYAPSISAGNES